MLGSMMSNFWLVNLVIFQSVWWLSALFTHQALIGVMLLLALHFALSPSRKADLSSLMVVPVGLLVDQALAAAGVIQFAGDQPWLPVWLAFLWVHFTLTLNHSLSWLGRCHLGVQSLLGAVFGALSYIGGIKLGALDSALSVFNLFIVFGAVWAVVLPLVVHLNSRFVAKTGVQHV
ncbi:DUF2878 domain-containing protein [Pseudoalteromonas sp. R3]|nr:DUF2878 domain-containing protein [Pseudoalteromonas sp. R3]